MEKHKQHQTELISAITAWLIILSLAGTGGVLLSLLVPVRLPEQIRIVGALGASFLLFIFIQLLFLPVWHAAHQVFTGHPPAKPKMGQGTLVEAAQVLSVVLTWVAVILSVSAAAVATYSIFTPKGGLWSWAIAAIAGLIALSVLLPFTELFQKVMGFLLSGGVSEELDIVDATGLWNLLRMWQRVAHLIYAVELACTASSRLPRIISLILDGEIRDCRAFQLLRLRCAEHRRFSQGRDTLRAAIARQSLTSYSQFLSLVRNVSQSADSLLVEELVRIVRECTVEGQISQKHINNRLRDLNTLMERCRASHP